MVDTKNKVLLSTDMIPYIRYTIFMQEQSSEHWEHPSIFSSTSYEHGAIWLLSNSTVL